MKQKIHLLKVCLSHTVIVFVSFLLIFRLSERLLSLASHIRKRTSDFLTVTLPQRGQFQAYQVYLLSATAHELRHSQYTDIPTGYELYTCFFNLYDLYAIIRDYFHHPKRLRFLLYDAYRSSLIVCHYSPFSRPSNQRML